MGQTIRESYIWHQLHSRLERDEVLPNTNAPDNGAHSRIKDDSGTGIKWDTNGIATIAMFIPENHKAKRMCEMVDNPQVRIIRNRISEILHRIETHEKVGYDYTLKYLVEAINFGLINGELPVEDRVKNLGELIATAIRTIEDLDGNDAHVPYDTGNRWKSLAEHVWQHDDRLLQTGSTFGNTKGRSPAKREPLQIPNTPTAPRISSQPPADRSSATTQGSHTGTSKSPAWKPSMRARSAEGNQDRQKTREAPNRGESFIGAVKAAKTGTTAKSAPSLPPVRQGDR